MKTKAILILFISLISFFKSVGQLNYETALFNCITIQFEEKGWNLGFAVDSLKRQLCDIGYLSDSTTIYDLLKGQSLYEEVPLTLDYYIPALDIRDNGYDAILSYCVGDNKFNIEISKYGFLVNELNKLEKKIPSEIWRVMSEVLDKNDFHHPYYELLAFMAIQTMSMDSAPDWYYNSVDTTEEKTDKLIILEATAQFVKLDGVIKAEKEIQTELINVIIKNPKNHFILVRLDGFMHNKRLQDIHSILSGSYYAARETLTVNDAEIRHFELLEAIPYRYRINY